MYNYKYYAYLCLEQKGVMQHEVISSLVEKSKIQNIFYYTYYEKEYENSCSVYMFLNKELRKKPGYHMIRGNIEITVYFLRSLCVIKFPEVCIKYDDRDKKDGFDHYFHYSEKELAQIMN